MSQPGMGEEGYSPESGMVTVETAIGLGGVVVVAAALVLAISVGGARAEVCQAAREAARAVSLGSTPSTSAPSRRPLVVTTSGDDAWVTGAASMPAFVLGPWSAPSISCEVAAVREPYLQWSGSGG